MFWIWRLSFEQICNGNQAAEKETSQYGVKMCGLLLMHLMKLIQKSKLAATFSTFSDWKGSRKFKSCSRNSKICTHGGATWRGHNLGWKYLCNKGRSQVQRKFAADLAGCFNSGEGTRARNPNPSVSESGHPKKKKGRRMSWKGRESRGGGGGGCLLWLPTWLKTAALERSTSVGPCGRCCCSADTAGGEESAELCSKFLGSQYLKKKQEQKKPMLLLRIQN